MILSSFPFESFKCTEGDTLNQETLTAFDAEPVLNQFLDIGDTASKKIAESHLKLTAPAERVVFFNKDLDSSLINYDLSKNSNENDDINFLRKQIFSIDDRIAD